jgi:transposase
MTNRAYTAGLLEAHGASKLTEAQVRVIKQSLADGMRPRALAKIYMVGTETIARIKRGDTWGWVTLQEPQDRLDAVLSVPLSEEEDAEARAGMERAMKVQEEMAAAKVKQGGKDANEA